MRKLLLLFSVLLLVALPSAALADVVVPGTRTQSNSNYIINLDHFPNYRFFAYGTGPMGIAPYELESGAVLKSGYKFSDVRFFAVDVTDYTDEMYDFDLQWNSLSEEQKIAAEELVWDLREIADNNERPEEARLAAVVLYANFNAAAREVKLEDLVFARTVSDSAPIDEKRTYYVLEQNPDGSFTGVIGEQTMSFNWLFIFVILLPLAGIVQAVIIIRRKRNV